MSERTSERATTGGSPVGRLVVDPRRNGLNTVRLGPAGSVLVYHSFLLTGRTVPYLHGDAFFQHFGVDGFFVISGALLSASYLRRPDLIGFIRNRALRILPGYWVCLAVIACVFAPVAVAARGLPSYSLIHGSHAAWRYVVANITTASGQKTVGGTPTGTFDDHNWDGSLWTLGWEGLAYLGLAGMGTFGLLGRRRPMVALTAAFWLAHTLDATGAIPSNAWVTNGSRLGLMFCLGILITLFGPCIPATRTTDAVAAACSAPACFPSTRSSARRRWPTW